MWKSILFLLLLFFISNCKTTIYDRPDEFQGLKLHFGNGGGFTGAYKEYLLMENGQVFFRSQIKVSYEELEMLDKKQIKQLFNTYNELNLGDLKLDDPGNLYYFLIHSDGDSTHKMQWGGGNMDTPEYLKIYYQNLMNLMRGKNPIK